MTDGVTRMQVPGVQLLRCSMCHAAGRDPFPGDWFCDLMKIGPPQGPVRTYAIAHLPDCAAPVPEPRPGIAVRVPGRYVSAWTIEVGKESP